MLLFNVVAFRIVWCSVVASSVLQQWKESSGHNTESLMSSMHCLELELRDKGRVGMKTWAGATVMMTYVEVLGKHELGRLGLETDGVVCGFGLG